MAKRTATNVSGESRRFRRGEQSTADYGTVDPELLRSAIAAAASTGGALRFGYSRDGGAYAIGIYGDGEPYTEFVRPSEDMSGFLRQVEELFLDLASEELPSAGSKKRP